jgi:hypothetical protein
MSHRTLGRSEQVEMGELLVLGQTSKSATVRSVYVCGHFSFLVILGRSLTGLAILLKVGLEFQDYRVYQARSKRISDLPF